MYDIHIESFMQNIFLMPDNTIVNWSLNFYSSFLLLLIFKYTAKGQHAEIIKLLS